MHTQKAGEPQSSLQSSVADVME